MIARPQVLFERALARGYAFGAFNCSNLEVAQAIIAGAAAQRSPVIVQTSEGAIEYAGLKVLAGMVRELSASAGIPVVLHLDHGKSLATAKACIDAGYTSVMIDASKLSLAENIQLTQPVVEYAHERRVWVEAELGAILGKEGAVSLQGQQTPENLLTRPEEAVEFVQKTGVDALAVSVGTIHGAFTGQEYIRFELLDRLQAVLPDFPLVLHGGSGISDAHLQRAARTNVCKINVDTELRIAFLEAVRAFLSKKHELVDPRDILGAAREAVQAKVEEKIRLFGSEETVD